MFYRIEKDRVESPARTGRFAPLLEFLSGVFVCELWRVFDCSFRYFLFHHHYSHSHHTLSPTNTAQFLRHRLLGLFLVVDGARQLHLLATLLLLAFCLRPCVAASPHSYARSLCSATRRCPPSCARESEFPSPPALPQGSNADRGGR